MGSEEAENLEPEDQILLSKSIFTSSGIELPHFSEPQLPNLENGDNTTFWSSKGVIMIKRSNGKNSGVSQQESEETKYDFSIY